MNYNNIYSNFPFYKRVEDFYDSNIHPTTVISFNETNRFTYGEKLEYSWLSDTQIIACEDRDSNPFTALAVTSLSLFK